jgi:hypothetical protein
MCRCTDIMLFQNPPYMASLRLLIPWIAAAGTSLSPLPCQAWHGYMVTHTHRVEVEVGADGHASAPLSGAAAAAPPAGARPKTREWPMAYTLATPTYATEHVFHSTPGDGWTNRARQQHVSAASTLLMLLRRIK